MEWLFDATPFTPRHSCGLWTPELIWVYIIANGLIALSYYAIPIFLYIFHKKRKDLIVSRTVTLAFICFITSCGTTHLCQITVFWYPAYRFYTFVDTITASLSVLTACLLPLTIKRVMNLPSEEQHQELVDLLTEEIDNANRARLDATDLAELLQARVRRLEEILQHKAWTVSTRENLTDLKRQLTILKEEVK